jgi:hypothetical protein
MDYLNQEEVFMDIQELVDDEVEAEKVMNLIKENVRKRRLGYDYTAVSAINPVCARNELFSYSYDIQKIIEYINSNSDIINNDYYISSHRPIFGKFLVKGRELIHEEVCRYVDPALSKQSELNANLVKIINEMMRKIHELEKKIKILENK